MICYDENPVRRRGGPVVPYDRLNATKHYLTHYYNLLYLDFISKRSDRFEERAQASRELLICQRKLDWWKRHPNWNRVEVEREVVKLKASWSVKRK